MNLKEYITYVIANDVYKNKKWFFSLFTLHNEDHDDEFMLVKDNMYYLKIDGEEVLFNNNRNLTEPAIKITDTLLMSKGEISNINRTLTTSVGILFINLIRLSGPFNGKFPYINKMFNDKVIEKQLPRMLKAKEVTIPEYLKYVDSLSYILPLANIFTYSSTIKTITPPPGMSEKKKELNKEFAEKYGEGWEKDATLGIQFGLELKKFDNEYLKDDPSYNKMLGGKVTNNSRPRLYGSFGVEYGFDKTGKKFKFIKNSLSEGYPKNREELAALFNSARAASFDRGSETQQGGSLAKDMLRPTSSLRILEGDCGVSIGRPVYITENTAYRYEGSYIIEKGKTTLITDVKSLIGKTLQIRSPQYCIQAGDNYCEKCLNENMMDYKEGLPLLMIEGGGIVLNAKMKSMHKATKKTMNFNILNVLR